MQPAFKRAYRTIVAADIVTGIAAAVLYLTAVSSVRGFALTLGVATLLDLFVVYFFKRPTVFLIARSTGWSTCAASDWTAAWPARPSPWTHAPRRREARVNVQHAIATYRGHRVPHFRLIEHRNWWFVFSGVLIALSLIGIFVSGLNFSIDFKGGAQLDYTVDDDRRRASRSRRPGRERQRSRTPRCRS